MDERTLEELEMDKEFLVRQKDFLIEELENIKGYHPLEEWEKCLRLSDIYQELSEIWRQKTKLFDEEVNKRKELIDKGTESFEADEKLRKIYQKLSQCGIKQIENYQKLSDIYKTRGKRLSKKIGFLCILTKISSIFGIKNNHAENITVKIKKKIN